MAIRRKSKIPKKLGASERRLTYGRSKCPIYVLRLPGFVTTLDVDASDATMGAGAVAVEP